MGAGASAGAAKPQAPGASQPAVTVTAATVTSVSGVRSEQSSAGTLPVTILQTATVEAVYENELHAFLAELGLADLVPSFEAQRIDVPLLKALPAAERSERFESLAVPPDAARAEGQGARDRRAPSTQKASEESTHRDVPQ